MTIKLSGLSLKELISLRSKVETAIQKLETTNLSKARLEAAKLAKEYGVTLEALVEDDLAAKSPKTKTTTTPKTKKIAKKVPPKYRHPDDSSLTWTGRGLKPKWIVGLLENGVTLNDLVIK